MSDPGKGPDEAREAPSGKGKDGVEAAEVRVGAWEERKRVVRRAFPGPADADETLRVAFESEPYAELVAHAKESLDKEVCGVLAGEVCEDDQGRFVHVKAVVRGASAREGGSHVTYTQETWNAIHAELEGKYPKLGIVGWYHSHPGFGVEFSEMDEFIQRNFFPGAAQVAFVTDPLGGDEAICFNVADDVRHAARFWVDGRERRCRVPADSGQDPGKAPGEQAASPDGLRNVEAKLGQLVQAFDEQQASYYRFLLTVGIFVAVAVVIWIGFSIYSSYARQYEPPRTRQYVRIPVKVGDKVVFLGVNVVDWEIPPELDLEVRLRAEITAKLAEEMAAQLRAIDGKYREEIERLRRESGSAGKDGAAGTNDGKATPQ